MLYREAGQFKTSYVADQAIFPILQDRIFVLALLAVAFLVVPLVASEYRLHATILIPFLILSLAAIGLNILIGYCGQVSLGTGGFMAVGAYAAYNLGSACPSSTISSSCFLFGGLMSAARRHPVRPAVAAHQGLLSRRRDAGRAVLPRLAVRARQVADQLHAVGLGRRVGQLERLRLRPSTRRPTRYLLILAFVVVLALVAKNLVRGHIGRSWMAIRDMDIAAEIIGIRPLRTKLIGLRRQSRS